MQESAHHINLADFREEFYPLGPFMSC